MERHTGEDRGEQPLFLDEPPLPPRRVEPDTSHLDGLFADENALPAYAGRGQATGLRRGLLPSGPWTLLLIVLILVAAAVGYITATALLR